MNNNFTKNRLQAFLPVVNLSQARSSGTRPEATTIVISRTPDPELAKSADAIYEFFSLSRDHFDGLVGLDAGQAGILTRDAIEAMLTTPRLYCAVTICQGKPICFVAFTPRVVPDKKKPAGQRAFVTVTCQGFGVAAGWPRRTVKKFTLTSLEMRVRDIMRSHFSSCIVRMEGFGDEPKGDDSP